MSEELIRRSDAIEAIYEARRAMPLKGVFTDTMSWAIARANAIPTIEAVPKEDYEQLRDSFDKTYRAMVSIEPKRGEWIPCSERLPEDIRPVLVTWKNTDPASYYQYIVGKHFIGTAHYHRGKWYWYSSVTEDLLAEYGKCDSEEFDEAIEAVAWMPLPKPWKGADDE